VRTVQAAGSVRLYSDCTVFAYFAVQKPVRTGRC